jgi:DNA-binding CsgD family transcriptional regulator
MALLRSQRVGLPAPASSWLLLLALGQGNLPLCTRAGQALGLTLADLAPAERAGLVRASLPNGVTWPEPLTPLAVIQDAAAADSARACRALAEASSPVSEPVNHPLWLAGALSQSQDASRALGAAVLALAGAGRLEEAYELAGRAAEVASDPVASLGHRVTAAELCWIAGYGDYALHLLDELPWPLPPGDVAASAAVLRAVITGVRDSWSASPAPEVQAAGAGQLMRSVGTAVMAGWESAPPDWLSGLVKRLRLAYSVGQDTRPVLAAEVMAEVIGGDSNPPAEHRAALLSGAWWHHSDDPLHPKAWPPPLLPAFIGEEAGYAARYADLLAMPRNSAARTTRALLQLKLGTAQAVMGLWDEALASTSACVRLAEELQLGALASDALVNAAWIHASRGDERSCTQALSRAARHQVPRADGQPPWYVCWAWGLLQLSLGRPAEAYEWLLPLQSGPVPSPKDHAIRRLSTADFVTAAVRAGHAGEAEAALAGFTEWAGRNPASWVRLDQALASAAVAADTDPATAEGCYQAALERCGPVGRRAVTARAEFYYGSWLRRSRRRQEARPHLRVAEDLFGHLGAIPWQDRAHAERRAAGAGDGGGEQPADPLTALTAQELRIARAAASGSSNRQIGQALGLSPRTVGYHLYKIFPKLDVTSRAQLAAALRQVGLDDLDGRP